MLRSTLRLTTFALLPIAANAQDINDLSKLSIQDLGQLKVTSVSKKAERRFEAPAAVYVLTSEEIKRSGATSIAEALRQVPGLEVARIDSNKWAISSRGFNRQFVNKLLVVVDGRSVYTPLFSGTYWDVEDKNLDDIERIEVIRGPGASLWGANAVNGVINIITKNAKHTQGSQISGTLGTLEEASLSARNGGSIDDNLFYRTSFKTSETGNTELRNGTDAYDQWSNSNADIRLDYDLNSQDSLTMLVNANKGQLAKRYVFPDDPAAYLADEEMYGANSLLRWERSHDDGGHQLQVYVDYIKRDMELILDQDRITFDIDWQKEFNLNDRFNVIWGLGYRYFKDTLHSEALNGKTYLDYTPDESSNNLYSAFVQGKYDLVPEKLNLTLGSKFEHNFYTDYEYQPTARITWTPTYNQTLWGAVSKAIRIPSRGERTITLGALASRGTLLFLSGDQQFDSENLIAYEAGYRIEPVNWMSIDATAYFNDYDDLRSYEPNGTRFIPVANNMNAHNKGVELSTTFLPTPNFSITTGYSYFDFNLFKDPGSRDPSTTTDEGTSPKHSFNLLTRYNITENLEFDTNAFFRSALKTSKIDEYTRLDFRLGWTPLPGLDVSLVGQNLLDPGHTEFTPFLFAQNSEIPRSLYVKTTFNF